MATLVNNLGGTLGFGEQSVYRNDDSYNPGISLATIFGSQKLNFFGTNYDYVSINNNGNVTFSDSPWSGLENFTPFGLATGGHPIIAAFFADVDTRLPGGGGTADANQVTPTPGGTSRGSDIVWYDMDSTGFGTLTVTWDDVGYFNRHTEKLNAFQLQLVGTDNNGNFDIIFRYEDINWTTGTASGGTSDGLGGTVARAGYSTGDGTSWYELPQSGIQDSMLGLESALGNTGVAGYYKFSVRSGTDAAETINGTINDDLLAGAGGNDIINGLGGNDTLIGNAGNDTLVGGTGNDTFVTDGLDTITELTGAGTDTVMSDVTHTLGNNLENLLLSGANPINGTGNSLNNILRGNSADNTLNGLAGNDTIDYSLATYGVTVNLGLSTAQHNSSQGSDTLLNFENIIGSNSNDTLTGNNSANILNGGLGSDTMAGGSGNDTYIVDNASDQTTETSALLTEIDTVHSSVTRTLGANLENLTLTGSMAINGTGNALHNQIIGNAADNTLRGETGNDTLNGNAGIDCAAYDTATAGVTVNLSLATAQNTVSAGLDTLTGIENLEGSNYNDTLTGNALANTLSGGTGNDVLNGGAGNDSLVGGTGNDGLSGGDGVDSAGYTAAGAGVAVNLNLTAAQNTIGAGLDTLTGIENLEGSNYNDTLTGNALANALSGGTGNDVLNGGAGNDSLNGGAGTDMASYTTASAGLTVNLNLTAAQNTVGAGFDTLTGIENLTGGNLNDTLTGNTLANTLIGGTGADSLNGDAGNDTLIGGTGNDTLIGGIGIDLAAYNTATTGVTVNLNLTAAQNTVGAGLDTLTGIENLVGSNFNDTLIGNALANALNGGGGNDALNGSTGNDTLIGGLGKDSLTGGLGADRFDFNDSSETGLISAAWDVINDFKPAELDKIDLSTIDAISTVAGDQAFTFIGATAFSSTDAAGQLRFDGAAHILYGSTDADNAAEFAIQLTGVASLLASDFVV